MIRYNISKYLNLIFSLANINLVTKHQALKNNFFYGNSENRMRSVTNGHYVYDLILINIFFSENVNFWTQEEKDIMRNTLASHLQCKKLPSFAECEQFIKQNPKLALKIRETVKGWINNEVNKGKKIKI